MYVYMYTKSPSLRTGQFLDPNLILRSNQTMKIEDSYRGCCMMMNTQDSQNTTYYGFQVYVWAKSQSPITGQFVDPCLWLTNTLPLFSAPMPDKLKIWRRQILSRVYEEPNKLPARPGLHTPFAPTENESTREIPMIRKILKHS